jgi:choline kinase
MQLIVLSAGKGSRLPKKFRKKPKCLVEIKNKPLLLYNSNFFNKFRNKVIVSGYKDNHLKKIAEKIGFRNIKNEKYSSTNMVYSLFLTKKIIREDVVVVYGDVIFNENIFKLLKLKKDILPVNVNWLKNWKNRMPIAKILNDAENLLIKNNNLLEIGTKIDKNKLPKYQFMGIIKLKKTTFLRCCKFFKKIKNDKIDMTSFLNLCVKNKILSLNIKKYNNYWYEIDTISDYRFAKRDISRW